MVKGCTRRCRKYGSQKVRPTPYAMISSNQGIADDLSVKKSSDALDKKDWIDATCSVCMEFPHNAVLLLCSSYEKGCRPYMCGTSCRYSNCLEQYKKASAKENKLDLLHDTSEMPIDSPDLKSGTLELACPLCRGQVKGWTVVEPARQYLNAKKRNCMHDSCTFVGTYKELRKHVRGEHPCSRPRNVDPAHEQRWRRFMRQQERRDAISYVMSMMPGAMVLGRHLIDRSRYSLDRAEAESDEDRTPSDNDFASHLMNLALLLHSLGSGSREHLARVSRRIATAFGRPDIAVIGNTIESDDTGAEDGNRPN